jgi:hypothetical protein
MVARLRSLTPLALVTARPARARVDGARYDIISLVGRRVMLVTSHSVDAPEIDYAVCRGHESGCVKGFGCRPHEGRRRLFGGRRPKASKGGNRAGGT